MPKLAFLSGFFLHVQNPIPNTSPYLFTVMIGAHNEEKSKNHFKLNLFLVFRKSLYTLVSKFDFLAIANITFKKRSINTKT